MWSSSSTGKSVWGVAQVTVIITHVKVYGVVALAIVLIAQVNLY